MPARRRPPAIPPAPPYAAALCAAVALAVWCGPARAGDGPAEPAAIVGGGFLEDACDADADGWRAETPPGAVERGVRHFAGDGDAAPGCAEAAWQVAAGEAALRFVRPVPPAAAIEDLTARLSVFTPPQSPHRAAACVRVSFPHAVDPATGAPPFAWITGDPVDPLDGGARGPDGPGGGAGWVAVSVATTRKAVDDARRRVRFALGRAGARADLSSPHVDRAGVALWAARGPAGVRCDDLRVGPLVPVAGAVPADDPAADAAPRAVVRGGRMTVDGAAFFPRLTYHHGADPAALRDAGFNLVQALDWRDERTLGELAAAGLNVAATPPQAGVGGAGAADINAPADAGLAPFTAATDAVAVWHLHHRFGREPGRPAAVRRWAADVRAADARRRRPVLFGVTEREAEYSRTADLLAVSRFVCGTALPLWEHSALLREAVGRKVRPGEPVLTWVQTGPHRRTRLAREAAGLPPAVIEPELIERQAFAAVAAGVKGLGFHLDAPLDDPAPAARERRLALTLTNARLAAVEPILAGATRCELVDVRPLTEGDPAAANRVRGRSGGGGAFRGAGFGTGGFGDGGGSFGGGGGGFGTGGLGGGDGDGGGGGAFGGTFAASAAQSPAEYRPRGVCDGAVLHRGSDRLVVATWQGEHDQFVPGPAPFTGAEVTIPAALPTAAAWVVTPVGLSNVPHEVVAGGMRVTLPDFDGVAVVLVTPDHAAAAALRRRVAAGAPAAAAAAVELAKSKLERTKITGAALRGGVTNERLLDGYLRRADAHLARAVRAVRTRDFDVAYAEAERCKRFCRAVQRAHWDRLAEPPAVAAAAADPTAGFGPTPAAVQPTAGPHLVAFSTLPDHLALARQVAEGRGAGVETASLLAPGDAAAAGYGDGTALPVSRRTGEPAGPPGPQQWSEAPPSVLATAGPAAGGGIRLSASLRTGFPAPDLLPRALMTVATPPVAVPADRAAVIRGELTVDGPVSGEGVTVYDSRGGAPAGLRWTGREPEFRGGGWVPFELVRPFPEPGREGDPLTTVLQLHGLGSARFRNLTVDVVNLDPAADPGKFADAPPAPPPRRRPACWTASPPPSAADPAPPPLMKSPPPAPHAATGRGGAVGGTTLIPRRRRAGISRGSLSRPAHRPATPIARNVFRAARFRSNPKTHGETSAAAPTTASIARWSR